MGICVNIGCRGDCFLPDDCTCTPQTLVTVDVDDAGRAYQTAGPPLAAGDLAEIAECAGLLRPVD